MLVIYLEFLIRLMIVGKRIFLFISQRLKFITVSILIVSFLFISPSVFAANPKITFQGRVVKSDGQGLADNAVQFKVQIRAPNAASCILYEETRTVDMTGADGLFTLDLNGGSGTRTDTNTFAFAETLSNYKAFAVDSSLCDSGAGTVTYTPAANDERTVKMYFKDSTMGSWEAMPSSTLTHSAFAYESRQVGGFPATSLLRVENGTGPQTATAFTPAQFTDLTDLIAGTSTKYAQLQTNAGTALSQSSGNPSTLTTGNVWYDTAANKLKFYDGTSVVELGTSGGSSISTGSVAVSSTSSATSASLVTLSPTLSATVAAETTASRSIMSPVIQTGVTSAGPLIGSANLALRNYNAAGDVGTASYLEGVQVNYGHSNFDASTPTTTNAYGVLIYPYTKTGTITNMIDVYLASALTGSGTVTNGWGIYQQNTKANSFAGKIGLGTGSTIPTALLNIAAGTAAAGTAPLKFTSGVLLTTPEDGAMEYDGTNYYLTTGVTRRSIASGASQGNIDNTSGNLTLNPNTATGAVLVSSTTASTAYNNGALVVSGGVGIAENLNVQGNITSLGTIAASTSVTSPIMYGSSSASGNLTIDSTSNATKGNIILAPSGGYVGIGTTSPSYTLDVNGTIGVPTIQATGAGTNADLSINPKGNGQILIGGGGWTYNTQASGKGSILFNNGSTDSPNVKFAYANNHNFGIDSMTGTFGVTAASQFLRFIKDSDETGGAVIAGIDASGNASFLGKGYFGGYVGIGTTSPGSALDVRGTIQSVAEDNWSGINTFGLGSASNYYNGFTIYNGRGTKAVPSAVQSGDRLGQFRWDGFGASSYAGGSGSAEIFAIAKENFTNSTRATDLAFSTTPTGSASATERMRIASTGYVGIGTTTPGAKLDVNGNASISGSLTIPAWMGSNALPSLVIGTDPSYGLLRVNSNASIAVISAGTIAAQFTGSGIRAAGYGIQNSTNARANGLALTTGSIAWGPNTTMDSSISRIGVGILAVGNGTDGNSTGTLIAGNVGIGTTSPTSPLHIVKTDVTTSGTNYALQIVPTYNQASGTSANTDLLINRTQTAVGSGTQYLIDAQVGGVSKFKVDNAGSMTITGQLNTGVLASSSAIVGGYLSVAGINMGTSGTFRVASTNTLNEDISYAKISPTYNKSTATSRANTDLLINRTETNLGTTPGAQYLFDAQVGGTSKFNVTNTGVGALATSLGINSYGTAANLGVGGTVSTGLAGSTAGRLFDIGAGTITRTVDSGTVAHAVAASIQAPTFATSSATTYTNASTFYVGGPPTVGSNVTMTNKWAAFLNGNTYIGGNVGIGTTSPTTTLDVNGQINSAGAMASYYQTSNIFSGGFNVYKRGTTGDITAALSSGSEIGYNSFYGWDGSAYGRGAFVLTKTTEAWSATGHGSFYSIWTTPTGSTSNAERMRIDQNGNVGIGTTAPGYKLQVGVAADGSEARANAWNTLSDERLKKDFEIIPDSLEKILALNGYYYYWNRGTDHSKKIGVKAQEVEKVFPEVVSHGADGFLSVSYNHLVAAVIEAVKEVYYKWSDDSRKIHRELASVKNDKANKNEVEKLKADNKAKDKEILDLKKDNAEFKKRLDQIERKLNQK